MNINERTDWIKDAISTNKSKEEIYLSLLEKGEKVDDIYESYLSLKQNHEDASKKTIQIIVYFGALLIGVGVFSFIASNWRAISSELKVAIIMGAMIASYGAAWWLNEYKQLHKTAEALYVLGCIIYGAGIFLIGQIYHIRADWVDGFLLWIIGTMAMGFAVQAWGLYIMTIFISFIAAIGSPFSLFGVFDTSYSNRYTSTLLLMITMSVFFISGLLLRKRVPPDYFKKEKN